MQEIIYYKSKNGKIYQDKDKCILEDINYDSAIEELKATEENDNRLNSIGNNFCNSLFSKIKQYSSFNSDLTEFFKDDFFYWMGRINSDLCPKQENVSINVSAKNKKYNILHAENFSYHSQNFLTAVQIQGSDEDLKNIIRLISLSNRSKLNDNSLGCLNDIVEEQSKLFYQNLMFNEIEISLSVINNDMTNPDNKHPHCLIINVNIPAKKLTFIKNDVELFRILKNTEKIVIEKKQKIENSINQIRNQIMEADSEVLECKSLYDQAKAEVIMAQNRYNLVLEKIDSNLNSTKEQKIENLYAEENFAPTDFEKFKHLIDIFKNNVPESI